jgi:RIO-like serine/threonine protein kinase
MSLTDFLNEANVQKMIYKNTLPNPACPKIEHVFILRNEEARNTLMQIDNPIYQELVDALHELDTLRLGIIVMEQIPNAISFEPINKQRNNMIKQIYASEIIKMTLHLYFRLGIVHDDLHANNILINSSTGKCYLIDFGVITFVNNREMKKELAKVDDDASKIEFMRKYLRKIDTSFLMYSQNDDKFLLMCFDDSIKNLKTINTRKKLMTKSMKFFHKKSSSSSSFSSHSSRKSKKNKSI